MTKVFSSVRIGILMTFVAHSNQQGFYNAQDFGLAKALDTICEEVIVYKLVSSKNESRFETLVGCRNASVLFLPSKSIGNNGFVNLRALDNSLDALIYFSDTQLSVPKVYKWARKNRIQFFPYIGSTESHSVNRLKTSIINLLFHRNLSVYKKCLCLAKTPQVEMNLLKRGVKNTSVAPVGLDFNLLNKEYHQSDPEMIKQEWGFDTGSRVILLVGRMESDRDPLEAVSVFKQLWEEDKAFRLCVIGKGSLLPAFQEAVRASGIAQAVTYIDALPNQDMWRAYVMSECLVSFSRTEIFGMSILEAMYYERPVLTLHAPGPDGIILDGVTGYLYSDPLEMVDRILHGFCPEIGKAAHQRVCQHFTWETTARLIRQIAQDNVRKESE